MFCSKQLFPKNTNLLPPIVPEQKCSPTGVPQFALSGEGKAMRTSHNSKSLSPPLPTEARLLHATAPLGVLNTYTVKSPFAPPASASHHRAPTIGRRAARCFVSACHQIARLSSSQPAHPPGRGAVSHPLRMRAPRVLSAATALHSVAHRAFLCHFAAPPPRQHNAHTRSSHLLPYSSSLHI